MKEEYDFSEGVRGKFFRSSARLNLPVYLDTEVLDYLRERAQTKGVGLDRLVNDLLRKDIDLIESAK